LYGSKAIAKLASEDISRFESEKPSMTKAQRQSDYSSRLAAGKLFVVGTPIGNLGDITLRALETLKSADLIACEDTRRTQKLLNHYKIETPTISYHEHNEMTRAPELILEMEEGSAVALVSDAGTPVLSDPGFRLVHLAVRHKIPVIPIPGPSALVAALTAAGLPMNEFIFTGFLPAKKSARRRTLTALAEVDKTIVFYEAPHRILEALRDIYDILGDREMVVAREVTKLHEEFLRGPLAKVRERLKERPPKGELTVILGPDSAGHKKPPGSKSLLEEVETAKAKRGLDERSALKAVARARGIPRSEAYRQLQLEKSAKK
jgi:16S rRNA (cytidine1402-2'-O)-methyltransferase